MIHISMYALCCFRRFRNGFQMSALGPRTPRRRANGKHTAQWYESDGGGGRCQNLKFIGIRSEMICFNPMILCLIDSSQMHYCCSGLPGLAHFGRPIAICCGPAACSLGAIVACAMGRGTWWAVWRGHCLLSAFLWEWLFGLDRCWISILLLIQLIMIIITIHDEFKCIWIPEPFACALESQIPDKA